METIAVAGISAPPANHVYGHSQKTTAENQFDATSSLMTEFNLSSEIAKNAIRLFMQPDPAANDGHLPREKMAESIAGAIAFNQLRSFYPELREINRPSGVEASVDFLVTYEIDGVRCQIGIDPFFIPERPDILRDEHFREMFDRHTMSIKSLEVDGGITVGVGHFGFKGNADAELYSSLKRLGSKGGRHLFLIRNFSQGIAWGSDIVQHDMLHLSKSIMTEKYDFGLRFFFNS